jgi:hypothetical protein
MTTPLIGPRRIHIRSESRTVSPGFAPKEDAAASLHSLARIPINIHMPFKKVALVYPRCFKNANILLRENPSAPQGRDRDQIKKKKEPK